MRCPRLARALGALPGAADRQIIGPQKRTIWGIPVQALLRQLDVLTRQGPVLMILEDVHWIDPSTRELLDLLVERVTALPILLVVTHRPEFQHPWAGRPHATALTLSRLAR